MNYEAQIFGFEYSKKEVNRAIRFKEQYPDAKPIFPLIEKKLTKPECLYYLEQAGIKRPTMYTLGYGNNNCIGCVKGGKGYWNKIRRDFPEYFNVWQTQNVRWATPVFAESIWMNYKIGRVHSKSL